MEAFRVVDPAQGGVHANDVAVQSSSASDDELARTYFGNSVNKFQDLSPLRREIVIDAREARVALQALQDVKSEHPFVRNLKNSAPRIDELVKKLTEERPATPPMTDYIIDQMKPDERRAFIYSVIESWEKEGVFCNLTRCNSWKSFKEELVDPSRTESEIIQDCKAIIYRGTLGVKSSDALGDVPSVEYDGKTRTPFSIFARAFTHLAIIVGFNFALQAVLGSQADPAKLFYTVTYMNVAFSLMFGGRITKFLKNIMSPHFDNNAYSSIVADTVFSSPVSSELYRQKPSSVSSYALGLKSTLDGKNIADCLDQIDEGTVSESVYMTDMAKNLRFLGIDTKGIIEQTVTRKGKIFGGGDPEGLLVQCYENRVHEIGLNSDSDEIKVLAAAKEINDLEDEVIRRKAHEAALECFKKYWSNDELSTA